MKKYDLNDFRLTVLVTAAITSVVVLVGVFCLNKCFSVNNTENDRGDFIHFVEQNVLTGHDISVDESNFTKGCLTVKYDGYTYGHPKDCRKCAEQKKEEQRAQLPYAKKWAKEFIENNPEWQGYEEELIKRYLEGR